MGSSLAKNETKNFRYIFVEIFLYNYESVVHNLSVLTIP